MDNFLYNNVKIGKMHWILWIFLCFFTGVTIEDCPKVCECKWKGGKQTAVCIQSSLNRIPDLDPDTQVLDVSGNRLSRLTENIFLETDLINLQRIYMNNCGLMMIDSGAFSKLTNLVELDLSSNLLNFVPSISFREIGELRDLKLNSNPISRLTNDAFLYLPKLTKLELTDCRIGTIEMSAFRGLSSLEWLRLDNNKLITVQAPLFYSLVNLHGLGLSGNPWNCTCSIRDLVDWMHRNNVPFGIPLPSCNLPEKLKGISWDTLELEDFACIPTKISDPTLTASSIDNSLNSKGQTLGGISSTYENEISDESRMSTVYLGENATLECKIKATPDTKVRWYFGKNPNDKIVNGSTYKITNSQSTRHPLQKDLNSYYIVTESFHPIEGTGPFSSKGENEATKTKNRNINVLSRSLGYKVSKLDIIHASLREAGSYICIAESRAGSLSINFSLTVLNERNLQFKSEGIYTGTLLASVGLLSVCLLLICILIATRRNKFRSHNNHLSVQQPTVNHNGINGGTNATRVVLLMNKEDDNLDFENEKDENDGNLLGGGGGGGDRSGRVFEMNHFNSKQQMNHYNNISANNNQHQQQQPNVQEERFDELSDNNRKTCSSTVNNSNIEGIRYFNGYYKQVPLNSFDDDEEEVHFDQKASKSPPPPPAPKPDLIDDNSPRILRQQPHPPPAITPDKYSNNNGYFYASLPRKTSNQRGGYYSPAAMNSINRGSSSSNSNLYAAYNNSQPLRLLPNQAETANSQCLLLEVDQTDSAEGTPSKTNYNLNKNNNYSRLTNSVSLTSGDLLIGYNNSVHGRRLSMPPNNNQNNNCNNNNNNNNTINGQTNPGQNCSSNGGEESQVNPYYASQLSRFIEEYESLQAELQKLNEAKARSEEIRKMRLNINS